VIDAEDRPLPDRNDLAPYWTNAAAGRFVVQRCRVCATFQHPPAPVCYSCSSSDLDWPEVSGGGTIHSLTVLQQPRVHGFAKALPLCVIAVELDEQPGLLVVGNLSREEGPAAAIGDRVAVTFETIDETLALPQFTISRPREVSAW
jgi:uncharacterized OB-fold protein